MFIFYLILLVLSISCLAGLVIKKDFVRRLRALDPDLWERLHRPGIFTETLFGSFAFMQFLFRRDYEGLLDSRIVVLGSRLRVLLVIYGASFIFFVIWLVFLGSR